MKYNVGAVDSGFYDHIDPNWRAVNLIDLYLAPLSSHLLPDKIKRDGTVRGRKT